jgi:hypothetical protein
MEGLNSFLVKRFVMGVLIAIVILWGVNKLIEKGQTSTISVLEPEKTAEHSIQKAAPITDSRTFHAEEDLSSLESHVEEFIPEAGLHVEEHVSSPELNAEAAIPEAEPHAEEYVAKPEFHAEVDISEAESNTEQHIAEPEPHTAEIPMTVEETPSQPDAHTAPQAPSPAAEPSETPHEHATAEPVSHEPETAPEIHLATGITFVNAVIEPLDYELNHRFYGWRPNDIIDVTDNVENLQRGVLEVTRRTVRILTERISRTGNTVAFNTHLENAMNWLMVKADTYWFPSPEAKYQEALDELELFKQELENGQESFFARTDNIIPLLQVFEDLLGSCEENLVKKVEKDGSKVGFFASDDYFFYSKGVASAMGTILEAVEEDFGATIESRKGMDDLINAIDSLHHACEIDPLIILNSDPDSLWANHRANMAAPISHAKFYLGVLITTLET